MSQQGDFEFIVSIIEDFVSQKQIKNRLAMIINESIKDWEKWLQLELEFFLRTRENVSDVKRETSYVCDLRRRMQQFSMFIDLKFRRKYTPVDTYIMVELKCALSGSALVRKMNNDIDKVNSMLPSWDDGRSFWCIGFYTATKDRKDEKNIAVKNLRAKAMLDEYDTPTYHEMIKITPTQYLGCIIF